MSFHYSPRIVTDGLVFYVDAANPRSYVSGGTTWDDLSFNLNNGILTSGVTYNTSNGGSLVFDGINGFKKTVKTVEILGCSFEEFKEHLESKFETWMSWENYGKYNGELNYGWDIDHIIPLCSAKKEVDVINLNHYTNLQPLCSKINRDLK